MDRKLCWVWATSKAAVTPSKLSEILAVMNDIETVFGADKKDFIGYGLRENLYTPFCDKSLDTAEKIVAECEALGIDIMTTDDEDYPSSLTFLKDPPYVLYVTGNRINLNDRLSISLIGARESDTYGLLSAKQFAYDLAKCGVVVVSGIAEGGDTAALTGALDAGGTVISVVANGVDICYPSSNYELMKRVMNNGMVISEYPPGTEPKPYMFPIRNRIISGISAGTVVTSAKKVSGTLITAKDALDQSKDVFAVPGNITNVTSQGTNNLIKDSSAKPVTSAADILVEYSDYFMSVYKELKSKKDVFDFVSEKESKHLLAEKINSAPDIKTATFTEQEQRIMDSLMLKPISLEKLSSKVGIDQKELSVILTMLEMQGFIKCLPGNQICLNT